LKIGAGKGWRKSIGPIMRKTKKRYTESRRRGISYIQYSKRRLPGLVTSCVETTFYNTLLKDRSDGKARKKKM
jgi:hypothetical protein